MYAISLLCSDSSSPRELHFAGFGVCVLVCILTLPCFEWSFFPWLLDFVKVAAAHQLACGTALLLLLLRWRYGLEAASPEYKDLCMALPVDMPDFSCPEAACEVRDSWDLSCIGLLFA